jgi:hypothetical protein
MDEKKYRLDLHTGALSLPADHADRLIALGDGDAALLYLYILRTGGSLDTGKAAEALGRTGTAVEVSALALERAGVLASGAETPLPPPEELPEYTVRDIMRRSESDGAFRALVAEAQRVMGHALSRADLNTLFGIYDRLGMSGEVIMLLINHCAARLKKRYGENRLPTMHAVEKEAFRWANREIVTIQQAESYIAESERLEQEEAKALRLLGITDRSPTATERKYLDSWLAMGFGSDALALALDRTVVRTGKLSWAYMNSILLDWQGKGLYTPEDIEKGDVRPAGRKTRKGTARQETSRGDDLDRLERMLNIKE